VEESSNKTIGNTFLKINIFNRSDRTDGMDHAKALLRKDDFQFILSLSLWILLILFIFFFQSFAKVTFAFTLHFRIVFILTKIGGNIIFIPPIVKDKKTFAEGLTQHTC
jgi:hypothetical protein